MFTKTIFLVISSITISLVLASCATTQTPGSKPNDMSHEEHLAAAELEQQTAEKHEQQYDPGAEAQVPDKKDQNLYGGFLWGDPDVDYDALYGNKKPGQIYNPTAYHKEYAETHKEHASQHEEAAQALKKFEKEECRSVHKDVRHLCPLVGTVASVEKTKGGARIFIKKDVNADGVFAHARCHHAYGAYHGYKGMPNCPLYLKGVSVNKFADGSIEIVSDNAKTAKEILRRSKAHVEPVE